MSDNIQSNTTGRLTPCLQQKIDRTRYLVEVHFSVTSTQSVEERPQQLFQDGSGSNVHADEGGPYAERIYAVFEDEHYYICHDGRYKYNVEKNPEPSVSTS